MGGAGGRWVYFEAHDAFSTPGLESAISHGRLQCGSPTTCDGLGDQARKTNASDASPVMRGVYIFLSLVFP